VDVMKIAVEEASYKFSLVIENISWSPDGWLVFWLVCRRIWFAF
jgi:hypothetical protein